MCLESDILVYEIQYELILQSQLQSSINSGITYSSNQISIYSFIYLELLHKTLMKDPNSTDTNKHLIKVQAGGFIK